jgi:TRAP transporter TAXI family solute receptor
MLTLLTTDSLLYPVEMDEARFRKTASGPELADAISGITTRPWPRRVRIALVAGLTAFACGAGVFAYSYFTRPETLTVAAGSAEGDAFHLMSAIAARMSSTGSSVRLKVVDKGTPLEAVKAFSNGEADLATARGDIGDLSAAKTVVVVANAVVLIVVPPGSPITKIDDLKGKNIGVLSMDLNRRVVQAITKEYDLSLAKTNFKDLSLKDVAQSVQSKQVSAVLIVRPITEKYLAMVRDLFPHQTKHATGLVPIESAGAIAAVDRAYESYELPKGTIRGSPPVPEDDLTTLRVPFYLIANKNLSEDVVATLTKEIIESRRDLVSEHPLLAQLSSPNTDKDAYIPIHPGAAAYFNGEQKTFFDKYGDWIFYGSLLLGSLASLLAATWKFIARDYQTSDWTALVRLYALASVIGHATSEEELANVEQDIDDILKFELEKNRHRHGDAAEIAALGLATHRLEHLIVQRRATIRGN